MPLIVRPANVGEAVDSHILIQVIAVHRMNVEV